MNMGMINRLEIVIAGILQSPPSVENRKNRNNLKRPPDDRYSVTKYRPIITRDTLNVSGIIFLEYANHIDDNNMMVALNATILLISLLINR